MMLYNNNWIKLNAEWRAESEIQKWTLELAGFFCEYLKYNFWNNYCYYLSSKARTIDCDAHDKLWWKKIDIRWIFMISAKKSRSKKNNKRITEPTYKHWRCVQLIKKVISERAKQRISIGHRRWSNAWHSNFQGLPKNENKTHQNVKIIKNGTVTKVELVLKRVVKR